MTVPKGSTDEKCNIWLNRKKLILILKMKISTIYSKEKYKYSKYISPFLDVFKGTEEELDEK